MKYYKIIYLLLTIYFINVNGSISQNKDIDSLENILKTAPKDSNRVKTLNLLSRKYWYQDPNKSFSLSNEALKISENIHYLLGIISSYNSIGVSFDVKGEYNIAIEYYDKALKEAEKLGDKKTLSTTYNNLGISYYSMGKYSIAMNYYFKSLRIKEKLGDKKGIGYSLYSIARVYHYQEKFELAMDYYEKSLKIFEEIKLFNEISNCAGSIGSLYAQQGSYEKAMQYYEYSLSTDKKEGNLYGVAFNYHEMGSVYFLKNNLDKSLEYINNSLAIRKEIDDKRGVSNCYTSLSQIYRKKNNYPKAIEYQKEAINIAKEIDSKEDLLNAYNSMSVLFEDSRNFEKALEYHKLYFDIRDTLMNEKASKQIAEMETRYQTEKKQLKIEKLVKEQQLKNETIARKEAENKKQRVIIFTAIAGFILILIFSALLLRLFIQKKKAHLEIAIKNKNLEIAYKEINTQKEEIETQRDEIEAQRDLVTEQKERIYEIHKEVTDSINYAKRIQEAVLPISIDARSFLGEHFILFKPKDVVSGDFYWTTKINDFIIIAVADCTGHGVPGAFMSMLGISFLTEIVSKQEITQASNILNHLRIEIINALQQKGTSGEQKDGMDMALCVLNISDKKIQFAGANNSLYVIGRSKTSKQLLSCEAKSVGEIASLVVRNDEVEFYELKGDKMPVAIHEHMESFTNHEYQLQKNDCIYLLSDGYEDQFGGPKNKKFMAKQLKDVLVNINNKPMTEQKTILEKSFEDWKGKNEQVDDVTILGVRI